MGPWCLEEPAEVAVFALKAEDVNMFTKHASAASARGDD